MYKSFAAVLLAAGAEAIGYNWSIHNDKGEYGMDIYHDHIWNHGHYEPGNVERFDNHYAEIYGADDLAWGPNGYRQPNQHNDTIHNWDDQGDAWVCHACGGHGCNLCGGYGHFHNNAQFGYHGHTLKSGFGVGHNHAYLGKKVRSSYNKYGHGVGGRYSQRWSNGYGDRYGNGAGHRYGLAHRWSMYNGYGKGNPSSKGSVMGYGIGSNAGLPAQPSYNMRPATYDEAGRSPYEAY
jgi:hypothetical protein